MDSRRAAGRIARRRALRASLSQVTATGLVAAVPRTRGEKAATGEQERRSNGDQRAHRGQSSAASRSAASREWSTSATGQYACPASFFSGGARAKSLLGKPTGAPFEAGICAEPARGDGGAVSIHVSSEAEVVSRRSRVAGIVLNRTVTLRPSESFRRARLPRATSSRAPRRP
jgi:hypothetical protein